MARVQTLQTFTGFAVLAIFVFQHALLCHVGAQVVHDGAGQVVEAGSGKTAEVGPGIRKNVWHSLSIADGLGCGVIRAIDQDEEGRLFGNVLKCGF